MSQTIILAEHCQADATIAFCQQQQDLSAAAVCAAPTESEQTDGEKWRKTPPVLDGDFGGQVQLRGRAAVPCRLAAEGHGGGDSGELAGGAVGEAATGEGGSHEVSSGYVESGRALQCAPQGAQMWAGAALQLCAVQGTVNAPQGATPMTIDDAAAKMDFRWLDNIAATERSGQYWGRRVAARGRCRRRALAAAIPQKNGWP